MKKFLHLFIARLVHAAGVLTGVARAIAATALAIIITIGLGFVYMQAGLGRGLADHIVYHAVIGASGLAFLLAVRFGWPRPRSGRVGHVVRLVLLISLAVFVGSQLVELALARWVDGAARVNWVATIHDTMLVIGFLAMMVAMAGAVISAIVALIWWLRGR